MLVQRKEFQEKDGSIGYIESVYKSDNILKTTYFPNILRLYIAFSRGHTYSYGSITLELYQEFENAESQGVLFHKKINANREYPCRREYTLYPSEVQGLKEIVKEQKIKEDEENE